MVGGGVGVAGAFAVVEVQAEISNSPVKLAAKRWEMAIQPERGGRIISLRLDGEELLDQGIGIDQPTANGFVEAGARGWDEMVPNVGPTDTLPAHGEAWRLPWEVIFRHRGNKLIRGTGPWVPLQPSGTECDDAGS